MKIALVCDWLVAYAGAERVIEQILECFPEADLFAVIDLIPPSDRSFLKQKTSKTTFLQQFPWVKRFYRSYLPWMPLAIEQLDVSQYDLVISSSHAIAKGILTSPDQIHISYIHSPMRYAWDLQHQYLTATGLNRGIKGYFAKKLLHQMRIWDYRTANGVDHFVANSKFIAKRIWKIYRRDSQVIYPAIDLSRWTLKKEQQDYYLAASRIVPYKKMDLIVETFASLPQRNLIVIGDGPGLNALKKKATPNIDIQGFQPTDQLIKTMQGAKAFIFAAEEDFGLLPVEAQACGTPVIAYGKGGVLETVNELDVTKNPTGLFFEEQTVRSLRQTIERFEAHQSAFTPLACREQASFFSKERFQTEFSKFIQKIIHHRNEYS